MTQSESHGLYDVTSGLGVDEWLEAPSDFAGSIPPGSLLDTLGIRLTRVRRGGAVGYMEVREVHLNQRGIAQAGAVIAFADAVAGWASYASTRSRFATLNISTSLIRAVRSGELLEAEATVAHAGRKTQVVLVEVRNAETSKLVAQFTCNQMVFDEASG